MLSNPELQALSPSLDSIRDYFKVRHDHPSIRPHQDFSPSLKALHDREQQFAAVLIPIVNAEDGLQMVLTRRAEHLRDHPGQISFPGGRVEPMDDDFAATALRESYEEIGLPLHSTEVLGELTAFYTYTGYEITPVVGIIDEPVPLEPDPDEVAEIIHVPLPFLLDPQVYVKEQLEFQGKTRHIYAAQFGRHRIWGVTAAILINFYQEMAVAHQG